MVEEERNKYEAYRELEDLTSEMNFTVDAVVVEGPHDKKTLKLLGYEKPILICSKLSHYKFIDFSNVVILTDFDKEGIFLNKKISKLFEKRGVKVDRFYRRKFRALLKEVRILTIEGIYSLKLKLFPF